MKALTAVEWPRITRTPTTRITRTSGVIHHTLRRQKKDRSWLAIPKRAKRSRKNRWMAFKGWTSDDGQAATGRTVYAVPREAVNARLCRAAGAPPGNR